MATPRSAPTPPTIPSTKETSVSEKISRNADRLLK
jgi:hypothetical protein